MIARRSLLAAGAALSLPAAAQPARVMKFVPQTDLTTLDPIWTISNVARNHGYMVWDTLYGTDAQYRIRPQMAEGHTEEDDGRRVTVTLRAGLKFHDGEAVRAQDAVASIKRWARRSPTGQVLLTYLDEIGAADDRRIVFRLKRRFPQLIGALGLPSSPVCFIMPERLANTDPFQPVREAVGSGPYRFMHSELRSGSFAAWERYAGYSPTPDNATGLTAGPKLVHFDRIEWHTIPDAATASAALMSGEIDWFEQMPPEVSTQLERQRQLVVDVMDTLVFPCSMRMNHLQPPFDNPAIRRALLGAINQEDFMTAIVGPTPARFATDVGFFTPGTPLANDEALAPLKGPRSFEASKRALREAGYNGEPIRLLGTTDIISTSAMAQVAIDFFRKLDVNLDIALSDWGALVQRRNNRGPVAQGGWSVSCFANSGMDFVNPGTHNSLRSDGNAATPGWPSSPALEALRMQFFDAPELPQQQAIARDIQRVAMQDLPYIPLGGYRSLTAHKRSLVDRVKGFAIFWGIKRT